MDIKKDMFSMYSKPYLSLAINQPSDKEKEERFKYEIAIKTAHRKKERERVKSMVQLSAGMQTSPPKIYASGLEMNHNLIKSSHNKYKKLQNQNDTSSNKVFY